MPYAKITRLPSGSEPFYELRSTGSPSTIRIRWSDLGSAGEKMKPGALALGACWTVHVSELDPSTWFGLFFLPLCNIFEASAVNKISGVSSSIYLVGSRSWAESHFAEQFPDELWSGREITEAFKL